MKLLLLLLFAQLTYSSDQLKKYARDAYARGDWRTGNVLRRQGLEVAQAERRAGPEPVEGLKVYDRRPVVRKARPKSLTPVEPTPKPRPLPEPTPNPTVTPKPSATPSASSGPEPDHRIKPWGQPERSDPPLKFYP